MNRAFDERTSDTAIWCQRFAVFLIPYFLLVVPLYRFGKIETIQLFALLGIGLLIALVAIILAIRAATELWSEGIHGGSQLVRGSFIALLTLMPFLYYGFIAIDLPLANDVSTNPFDPPQYIAAIESREQQLAKGMNPIFEYTPEYASEIVSAYPGLQSRRYPAGRDRVYDAISTIIQDNEWPITASEGLSNPETTPQGSEGESNVEEEEEGAAEALEDNDVVIQDINLEFVQRTFLFGFENDVIVRIASENENTLVDVRSSSRWGKHDFGRNAKSIEEFLSELDKSLLGIAGEG